VRKLCDTYMAGALASHPELQTSRNESLHAALKKSCITPESPECRIQSVRRAIYRYNGVAVRCDDPPS
jgi:hypothetical protein